MSYTRVAKRIHPQKNITNVFESRRQKLLNSIDKDQIIIIPAHAVAQRNGDIEYHYHQESNFFYLTGFNEPDALLVLSPGRKEGEFILFNRPKDPKLETWTGKRAGIEGACEKYGADQAFSIEEFEKIFPKLIKGKKTLLHPMSDKANINKKIDDFLKTFSDKFAHQDISEKLAEMRLIKDKEEIALIRKAVQISEKGHLAAMKQCKPGMYEYQVEAKLMHEFLYHGSRAVSYSNIVASGENSCTLHYDENNRQIKDGDLVLIDAGAEYSNYSSDITRTFPANGKFSKEQRAIYDLVLKAQEAAIKHVKPGVNWDEIEEIVCVTLTHGLIQLGILKGDLKQLVIDQACREFYMHSAGHWMGLDVHDVGKNNVSFKPGMIHTLEPGLYIKPSPHVDKRWHNIGVRIEDDILVTKNGCEVLSAALPKKAADIEAIMAGAKLNHEEKHNKKSSYALFKEKTTPEESFLPRVTRSRSRNLT